MFESVIDVNIDILLRVIMVARNLVFCMSLNQIRTQFTWRYRYVDLYLWTLCKTRVNLSRSSLPNMFYDGVGYLSSLCQITISPE